MKLFKSALLFTALAFYSCTSETALPVTEVSFMLDGQTFSSRSTINSYTIEQSSSGLNELFITIIVDKKNMLLAGTSASIEGTYNHLNSIENELTNRIGLCDEVDPTLCKTTGTCENTSFIFTVSRVENHHDLLSGTFEGSVCNDQGQVVVITAGSFKNLKRYPAI